MPQFIMQGQDADGYQALDGIGQGFVTAMMWTDEEHHNGTAYPDDDGKPAEPRIEHPSADDIAPETFAKVKAIVARFREAAGPHIADAEEHANADQIGHDLWLTSQGHGVGFWDRDADMYGTAETRDALNEACKSLKLAQDPSYVGDDGKIYL